MAAISFAGSLLIVAVVLAGYEWQHYQGVLRDDEDAGLLRVSRVQFRRRMIVSGIIVLVAAMLVVGQWVPGNIAGLAYWGVVVALTCSVIGMAIMDFRASRIFLAEVKRNHQHEYEHLMAEITRFKSENEDPPPKPGSDTPEDSGN